MKSTHIDHPDFEFFNPNKHKCGDCAIRAIVKVTGKDWVNVFDDLCAIGRKMQRMPNDMKCIEKYLAGLGFKWVAIKPEPGEIRPTILDVVNWSKRNPGNRYIARISKHVVPVMDGKFYDLGDWSKHKSLYGYFVHDHPGIDQI